MDLNNKSKKIIDDTKLCDFELTEDEVQQIDNLDNNERTGAHPDHFMEHFANK